MGEGKAARRGRSHTKATVELYETVLQLGDGPARLCAEECWSRGGVTVRPEWSFHSLRCRERPASISLMESQALPVLGECRRHDRFVRLEGSKAGLPGGLYRTSTNTSLASSGLTPG